MQFACHGTCLQHMLSCADLQIALRASRHSPEADEAAAAASRGALDAQRARFKQALASGTGTVDTSGT